MSGEGRPAVGEGQRWIVEGYGHTDMSDYPSWGPIEGGSYYTTEQEAQEALNALVDEQYQRSVEGHERDVRACAERAAVYEAAAAAVDGMPQAHVIGRGYRTEPMKEPQRDQHAARYRVARVTSFQERVQELINSTRGHSIDKDDLQECFREAASPAKGSS